MIKSSLTRDFRSRRFNHICRGTNAAILWRYLEMHRKNYTRNQDKHLKNSVKVFLANC